MIISNKINSNNFQNKQTNNCTTRSVSNETISFKGLKGGLRKCMFALDQDGTMAHATNCDIQEILAHADDKNAVLVYPTGRNLKKFEELRREMSEKSVLIPTPEFLLGNNGLLLFRKVNNRLIEYSDWINRLKSTFDKDKIAKITEDIAFSKPFKMENASVKDFKEKNTSASKLCKFEFWTAPNMLQFLCDSTIADDIDKVIQEELTKNKLTARIIKQVFPKAEWDRHCNSRQLALVEPRYDKQNNCTQLDIVAAHKGDAIEFLGQKLGIPHSEIYCAGNDLNDISMAELTDKGSHFTCVANSMGLFKDWVNNFKTKAINPKNILIANKEGAAGIVEGINKL